MDMEMLDVLLELIRIPPTGWCLSAARPVPAQGRRRSMPVFNRLNSVDRNIMTVEDPVEYQVAGIVQGNVNPKVGVTFLSGLRTLLRQDPDVILIGEIRDVRRRASR